MAGSIQIDLKKQSRRERTGFIWQ